MRPQGTEAECLRRDDDCGEEGVGEELRLRHGGGGVGEDDLIDDEVDVVLRLDRITQ